MDLKFRGKIGTLMKGVRVCDRNPRREIWGNCETREKESECWKVERERKKEWEGMKVIITSNHI